ncbi:tail fiber protein [Sphingomonas sp.]|uniref:tail fiber protein n=1 Tax=Sphingomonas sp. TaxID=28214 RepID=UPI0025EA029F|nr:tail fiber protein [Sphingomonas sp.]
MLALCVAIPAAAQRFAGEIVISATGQCPAGMKAANGELLSVRDHDALFRLFGTAYGGDGVKSFALPDLRAQQIALNNLARTTPAPGATRMAPAMRTDLPLVYCVVLEGDMK